MRGMLVAKKRTRCRPREHGAACPTLAHAKRTGKSLQMLPLNAAATPFLTAQIRAVVMILASNGRRSRAPERQCDDAISPRLP
jgi:hypothetical protein